MPRVLFKLNIFILIRSRLVLYSSHLIIVWSILFPLPSRLVDWASGTSFTSILPRSSTQIFVVISGLCRKLAITKLAMAAAQNLTASELAAIAYALPPMSPEGLALALEILVYFFSILATITIILRIWVRLFWLDSESGRGLWGYDDSLAVLGFLPFIPMGIILVFAGEYGNGKPPNSTVDEFHLFRVQEYTILYEILYIFSSTFTKCSIAFTILRLSPPRKIMYIAWINIFFIVSTSIGCLTFIFTSCRPFAATWNPLLGTCLPFNDFMINTYVVNTSTMCTDWVSAILPVFIVLPLQMPMRRKMLVAGVLGLGVIASIAAVARLPVYASTTSANYLYKVAVTNLLSEMECGLAIIGCSMAPLRKLFVRFYRAYTSRSATKTSQASKSDAPKARGGAAQLSVLKLQGKAFAAACVDSMKRREDSRSMHQYMLDSEGVDIELGNASTRPHTHQDNHSQETVGEHVTPHVKE